MLFSIIPIKPYINPLLKICSAPPLWDMLVSPAQTQGTLSPKNPPSAGFQLRVELPYFQDLGSRVWGLGLRFGMEFHRAPQDKWPIASESLHFFTVA